MKITASLLLLSALPVSAQRVDWSGAAGGVEPRAISAGMEKAALPDGVPVRAVRRGCEAFEKMRAPFLEAAVKELRRYAGPIATSVVPASDLRIERLLASLKPETLANFREITAKVHERAEAAVRAAAPGQALDDKLKVRDAYVRSGELDAVQAPIIRDLANGPLVAIKNPNHTLWLYDKATGDYGGIEIDATLDTSFYSINPPRLLIRHKMNLAIGFSALPRIDLLMIYAVTVNADNSVSFKRLAPTTTDKVLNSAQFSFADPLNAGNPDRHRTFGFQGFNALLAGIGEGSGHVDVVYPMPPGIDEHYDGKGRNFVCEQLEPLVPGVKND